MRGHSLAGLLQEEAERKQDLSLPALPACPAFPASQEGARRAPEGHQGSCLESDSFSEVL